MKKTLVAVFTIFVMIVAACGGSDSGSDNESSPRVGDFSLINDFINAKEKREKEERRDGTSCECKERINCS